MAICRLTVPMRTVFLLFVSAVSAGFKLVALNEWLFSWCTEQKIIFVNNWNLFWERPRLFRADGLHPSRVGAELLSDNITRTLRSI